MKTREEFMKHHNSCHRLPRGVKQREKRKKQEGETESFPAVERQKKRMDEGV